MIRTMLTGTIVLTLSLAAAAQGQEITWPSPEWPAAEPADMKLDADKLEEAKDYALSAGGSGMIVRHGKVVLRWGDPSERYDIKSATKSFGATMLGVAIKDNKIELQAPARKYHPRLGVPPEENAETGWLDEITIQHLATQTAGFEKPGGYEGLLFKPGTHWHYSDGGPNWLAECITLQYEQDLEDLMFERVFTPLGIKQDDLRWRNNQYRDHQIEGIPRREFGAGIHANVEALSRLGYLYLQKGRWKDQQILSEEFVANATQTIDSVVGLPEWPGDDHGNASDHYGLLWWNNADGALENVPCDAYWAWGLYDSLIVVIPSLDIVVVRGGARGRKLQRDEDANHYDVLKPFLGPIVAAADRSENTSDASEPLKEYQFVAFSDPEAPYPPSPLITGVEWGPKDEIIRLGRGSDNWPLTWADNGHLYTAYGDGWGFEPRVEEKLSLGLGRVEGDPPKIKGVNVRSDFEETGDGRRGRKACGMLMVDETLYMFLRNADRQGSQSQLAWSKDHGKTWTEADWRFESLGYPTFLNFGQNYSGARDEFVYLVTHDDASAYQPADRFILMRVHKEKIAERDAYEFFVERNKDDQPVWTKDIDKRGAVFEHDGNCYRSGISYNAGLGRYVWCQIIPSENLAFAGPKGDMRFEGGFGVYDAPEPWGPWTTAYFTKNWDVGPGETSSLPPKWISEDGKTMWLVFSGDDSFSVRRANVTVSD
ncbi:MAG: serine hydrolase [Pirellulaceae bacterium]